MGRPVVKKRVSATKHKKPAKPESHPQEQEDDKSGLVSGLRKNMGDKLSTKQYKPSVGDYLKLLQMEQELEDHETKEIRVTWVEPEKSSSEE